MELVELLIEDALKIAKRKHDKPEFKGFGNAPVQTQQAELPDAPPSPFSITSIFPYLPAESCVI